MCTPIGLMLQEKAAKVSEIIALRGAVPRGLLQVGVMVDDLVVLEQALKTGFGEDGTYYGTWDSAERMIRVHACAETRDLDKASTYLEASEEVALGAVVKGRAAAQKLNTTMQTTLPYVLGGDIFSLPMCFFTSSRRGDAPTGDADLPELDLALPSWFESASDANLCEKGNWEASGKGTDHVAVPVQDEGNPFGYSKMRTLTNEAVAMLESFPSFPQRHFFFSDGVCGFFDAGGLDLYSGNYGVAKQMVKFGAPWVLTFEWKRNSSEDLLDDDLRK
ncbi:unnamed protein product, partial [Cladocopium goreaui]